MAERHSGWPGSSVRMPLFSTARHTFPAWTRETLKACVPGSTQELRGATKEKCGQGLMLTASLIKEGHPCSKCFFC